MTEQPFGPGRIFTPPPPTCLTFGGYRECAGCSKGLHRDHVDVSCMCGLCTEEEP